MAVFPLAAQSGAEEGGCAPETQRGAGWTRGSAAACAAQRSGGKVPRCDWGAAVGPESLAAGRERVPRPPPSWELVQASEQDEGRAAASGWAPRYLLSTQWAWAPGAGVHGGEDAGPEGVSGARGPAHGNGPGPAGANLREAAFPLPEAHRGPPAQPRPRRPPARPHRSPLARGLARVGAAAERGGGPAPAEGGAGPRRRRGAGRPRHGASPARPGAQPRGPGALSGRGSCAGGSGPGAAARPMERPRAGPPAGGRAAGGGRALR